MAASGLNPRDQVMALLFIYKRIKQANNKMNIFFLIIFLLFPYQGKPASYHLSALVDFALSMRDALEDVNKHSFNNFKMRIGKY